MTRLENLIAQTAYLMERQKQANTDCAALFADVLAVTTEKIATVKNDPEELDALKHIHELISTQAKQLTIEASSDVEFLEEQLEGLKKIQEVKDPKAAAEMLAMVIDADEEIKEFETFKEEVDQEANASRLSLMTMINDIKNAISEGSGKDVAMYLESVMDLNDDSMDEDDEFDDIDEDEDELRDCTCGKNPGGKCLCATTDDGCGSCSGCGTEEGGCGTDSVDLFGSLKDYEKSFFDKTDDSENQTQH